MKKIKAFNYSGRKELDLRKEVENFMFGANDEVPKGRLMILRKMRHQPGIVYPTTTQDLILCDCSDNIQNEPDKDYPCDICDGEKYLFDDYIIAGYKTNRFEYQDVEKYNPWGKNTVSMSFFYVQYHNKITRYDKVIEPEIDLEGNIASPLRIHHRHNIHMAERFTSDNGRTEYWRLSCFTD